MMVATLRPNLVHLASAGWSNTNVGTTMLVRSSLTGIAKGSAPVHV